MKYNGRKIKEKGSEQLSQPVRSLFLFILFYIVARCGKNRVLTFFYKYDILNTKSIFIE